jgi:hypothetical protein
MNALTIPDIEAIERATVAAVSPDLTEEIDGWLLPFAEGTVKRAKSAVPLHRGAVAARHARPHRGPLP